MEKIIRKFSLSGGITAPGSKSETIRALISAALYCGETSVKNVTLSEDVKATVNCLVSLGAEIKDAGDGVFIVGKGLTGGGTPYCAESASALRFLLPVAAALGKETVFSGAESLKKRPISALTDELEKHGVFFDGKELPIKVSGKLSGGIFEIPGDISSQYVSGLMLALPLIPERSEIVIRGELQSEKYAEMTAKMLKKAGVVWEKTDTGWILKENDSVRIGEYTVSGDWSGASYFAAAAALGGEIEISGLSAGSGQADEEIVPLLKRFGAEVCFENGTLYVKEKEKRPFSADVSQFPDLFPTLCALAAGADGKSRFYNASRLRIKESDRIESVKRLIISLGGEIEEGKDYLTVIGKGYLSGGLADAWNDHRIVMSAAVCGAVSDTPVTIPHAESAGKSFPDFFEKLEKVTVKK